MTNFKLQFYFNMYKDKSMNNRNDFRMYFRKKHKRFKDIEELIIMIEEYQFKKYGSSLSNSKVILDRKYTKVR